MKCLATVCFFLLYFSLLLATQDCPLPSNEDIAGALTTLIMQDGPYVPVTIESVHYVCQAQGNMINTYRSISIIATYISFSAAQNTMFQLECSNGVWEGDAAGGMITPNSSAISATTRTDCIDCKNYQTSDRCNRK